MKEPMPGDADPALMWELVSFVRRMAGRPTVRELNKSQPIGRQCFWTATPEMIAGLNDIVSRSNPSAQLTQSLARLSTRPAIQQLALEELEAAGYRDGVDVEHEELREIVCDKRSRPNRSTSSSSPTCTSASRSTRRGFASSLALPPHRRPPCRHHLPISCSNRSSQDARIHACGVPILYSAR